MCKIHISCVLSNLLTYVLHPDLLKKIDRHNSYREISGIYFPHHENPMVPLRSSLVDGELVIDVDPVTKKVFTFHHLEQPPLYDLLVIGENSLSGLRLSGY